MIFLNMTRKQSDPIIIMISKYGEKSALSYFLEHWSRKPEFITSSGKLKLKVSNYIILSQNTYIEFQKLSYHFKIILRIKHYQISYKHKCHDLGYHPWPAHQVQCPDLPCDLDMLCDLIMSCAWILTYLIKETQYLTIQTEINNKCANKQTLSKTVA